MIYVLLANGASVIPILIPGVPQLLLLSYMVLALPRRIRRINLVILLLPFVFIVLIIMALLNENETQSLFFAKLIVNIIVAAGLSIGLERKYRNKFGYVYTRAITLLTIVGVFGLLVTLFSNWSVNASIGERTYHTNLLTSWISDSGYNSSVTLFSPFPYRLQSMFDEPGTFGILLIPALFYSLERRFIVWSLVLLLGVFLSESINAWALCIPILFRAIFKSKQPWLIGLFLIVVIAGLIKIFPTLIALYEIKFGINAAYSNVSSFGVREMEYDFIFKHGLDYLLPFQATDIKNVFPNGISVSYIRWYLNIGIFALIIFIPIFLSIVFSLFRKKLRGAEDSFALVLVVTILLSGFQRSSFLDHIIFLTLIFWYLCDKKNLLQTYNKRNII